MGDLQQLKLMVVSHLENLKANFPWADDLRGTIVLRDPNDTGAKALIITDDDDPLEAVAVALDQQEMGR